MARKAKTDQTGKAALQAVEDALAIDFEESQPAESLSNPQFEELEQKLASATNDLRADEKNSQEPPFPDLDQDGDFAPDKTPVPANDDHDQSIADLLYAIQQKPRSRIYGYAFVISLLWIGLCGYYASTILLPEFSTTSSLTAMLASPVGLTALAILVFPIMLLWAFATLVRRAQEMRHAASSLTEAAIRLLHPENVASGAITTVGRAIRREVAAIGDGVERAIARAGELEFLVQKEVMDLEQSYGDSELRLTRLVEEISNEREEIIGHGEKLRETISGTHVGLSEELAQASSRIEDTVHQAAERLNKTVDERRALISVSLTEAGDALSTLLATNTETLNARLAAGKAEIEASVDAKSSELSNIVSTAGKVAAKLIETRTASMRDEGMEVARQLEDSIAIRSSEFSSRIAEAGEVIQSALDEKLNAIDKNFNTQGSNLIAALGMRTEALDKVLQERTKGIGNTIADSLTGFSESLTGQVEQTASKLQTQVEALQSNTKSVEEIIIKRTKSVEDTLKKGTVELANTIGESIEAVAGKSEAITNVLAERAAAIQDSLGKNLADAQTTLETSTKEFNELLASRTSELSSIIENDAKPVVASIEAAGNSVNAKLTEAHAMVSGEANTLFNKIGESTSNLKRLIEQTSINLGEMNTNLNGEAKQFAASVLSVKSDMEKSSEISKDVQTRLEATSSTILENMDGIAERFEAQGTTLMEATRLIDAAQVNFESTLESKQESLRDLAVGLVTRSDEINKTMTSFGEMITTMVEGVGERSKGVGEAVSAEISTAIDQATARFSETAEAMRAASESVRIELEETRAQMRRGVLELPEETHQSATAMRRVVADQVAALRELSDIVKKSGKMLDASSVANQVNAPLNPFPVQGTPVSAAPQPPQPFPPQSAQMTPPPMPVRHAPPSSLHQTPVAPAPAIQPGLRGTSDPVVEFAQQEPQSDSRWVGDLLRRASREDAAVPPPPPPQQQQNPARKTQSENRPPLHVVESLNSLSMDIARAIDHETSVELWERYQRGERNVFTRRLYTLQGQQTFDEIRNKYLREPEFRAAVDRYIEDFGRLLSDVSSNDRDSIMTQTYLTSDTGKVYTMLAHAAGKLGGG